MQGMQPGPGSVSYSPMAVGSPYGSHSLPPMAAGMPPSGVGRSPTFVVPGHQQQVQLGTLVRREQHFAEQYQRNKPLCFNGKSYQKTHQEKAMKGSPDADATLCSPMLVAVADGVSQIEEFGIDPSELPNELLHRIEELAVAQLLPGQETEEYNGPLSLMKDAYEATTSLGSTTILTAVMDNSTKIHGKLHPMVAVCSIGDCEIIILRRGYDGCLQPVFNTEMQRIDGNAQSPLQLARVNEDVDPSFDESIAIEVIENGSAVHCVSAFLGDICVAGTDGVFDNLYLDEVTAICEQMIPHTPHGHKFQPLDRQLLGEVCRCLVTESHKKTELLNGRYRESPIGLGGKIDDTTVVVAQVVEWTEEYGEAWKEMRSRRWWNKMFTCSGTFGECGEEEQDHHYGSHRQTYPARPTAESFSTYFGSSFHQAFGAQPHAEPETYTYTETVEPKKKDCSIM